MHPCPATFFDAWADAASGPDGFWSTALPSAHFRTASTLGPELAAAVASVLRDRPVLRRVVELGAGDGRLLAGLRDQRPDLALVGVDLRGRPPGVDPAVGWRTDRWDVHRASWTSGEVTGLLADGPPTLVLAVEWLDDLPCRVVGQADGRWRELAADLTAAGPPGTVEQAWLERWWPAGGRAEVGTTRDVAWAAVVGSLAVTGGAALLVDYGHTRDRRPPGGSLAAFRGGRSVQPWPRPDRNLTASVAVDAVAAAGTAAGARTVLAGHQEVLLPDLLPPVSSTSGPLAALAARSRRRALTSPAGWGPHHWLLQEVAAGAVAP